MRYLFEDFALDVDKRELFRGADAVSISPQALDLLVCLIRNRERVITDLKRISKPGRRVYARHDRLPRVLGGMGISILSTSKGVITSRRAAEEGVGGEVLAYVW